MALKPGHHIRVFCKENHFEFTDNNDEQGTQVAASFGKVYERCELARELQDVHQIPFDEIGVWVCIADQAKFNTSLLGPPNDSGHRARGETSSAINLKKLYRINLCA